LTKELLKSVGKLRKVLQFPERAVKKICKLRNVLAFAEEAVTKLWQA